MSARIGFNMTNLINFCKKDRSYIDNLILLISLFLITSAILSYGGGLLNLLYGILLILINSYIFDFFSSMKFNFIFATGFLINIIVIFLIYSGIILCKRKPGAAEVTVNVIIAYIVLKAVISFYFLYKGLFALIFGNLIINKAAYTTAVNSTRQGLMQLLSLVIYVVVINVLKKLRKEGILE